MAIDTQRRVLVTGGTGFVGQALIPRLIELGYAVRATTRDASKAPSSTGVEWLSCDIQARAEVERALEGVNVAFFLVHAVGSSSDYGQREQQAAQLFRECAERAGVARIVYLGGVEPEGKPSEHLQSRLRVGQLLREGPVPTLELRASMIIGNGSVSWQIVRDLALRLPAMLLPSWTDSRTRPIDIRDATQALICGMDVPLPESAWFDIPGPETLTARDILQRVAGLRGRRIPHLRVPFLTVSLSSWWLKLITGADFAVARELVLGLSADLLPRDEHYWELAGYRPRWGFDDSARDALASERTPGDAWQAGARWEESLVQRITQKQPR